MNNVDKYRAFCDSEPSVPLFSQPWWLDATAGAGRWDVALVAKGTDVFATMPYSTNRRCGFTYITQPALTQTLGPWMRNLGGKPAQQLAQQKEWMQDLIAQLPAYDKFSQTWSWRNTNWLPFYWKQFSQTTRYSYILFDLSDTKALWDGLQENIRREIKKAGQRFNLRIRNDLPVEDFLALNKKTFLRQKLPLPYSDEYVQKIDAACMRNNARKIFIAEDEQGRHHAAVYIIWDRHSAYYLMGGGDPELRNSGATSLCMWEAIQFAATVTRHFDFEGSMLEPVEKYFRAFGATQTPYFAISRTPSRLLRTLAFLRNLKADA